MIVEEDPSIAMDIARSIEEIGCIALGPAQSVDKALALLRVVDPDAALLDEALQGDSALPVATLLTRYGIPFTVVGAQAAPSSEESVLQSAARIIRPLGRSALARAVERMLAGARQGVPG